MKRALLLLPIVSLSILFFLTSAMASTYDITIWDNTLKNSTFGTTDSRIDMNGNPTNENNEVEYNCINNQNWDLEAFILHTKTDSTDTTKQTLTIVSGYNFSGYEGTHLGDIFFKIGTSAIDKPPYGDASPSEPTNTTVLNSEWNYNFAISLNTGTGLGTYTVYGLAPADLLTVNEAQNGVSNPLEVVTASATITDSTYTVTYDSYSDAEGTHYRAEIDLSQLLIDLGEAGFKIFDDDDGPGEGLEYYWWAHLTYSCGNDMAMAEYFDSGTGGGNPSVPVPPSVWLLGSGLLGFIGIGIRKRSIS